MGDVRDHSDDKTPGTLEIENGLAGDDPELLAAGIGDRLFVFMRRAVGEHLEIHVPEHPGMIDRHHVKIGVAEQLRLAAAHEATEGFVDEYEPEALILDEDG